MKRNFQYRLAGSRPHGQKPKAAAIWKKERIDVSEVFRGGIECCNGRDFASRIGKTHNPRYPPRYSREENVPVSIPGAGPDKARVGQSQRRAARHVDFLQSSCGKKCQPTAVR